MSPMTSSGVPPEKVHQNIRKYLIGDGFPLVFDLEQSRGSWVFDLASGEQYLDFYSFFASLPLGFNHPAFFTPENSEKLLRSSIRHSSLPVSGS